MKLDVPYYSQKIDVKDLGWKNRACGIVCLKMAMDFYKKDTPSLDELIKIGVETGAYSLSGWIHQGLIDIAEKFGLRMVREEFRSDDFAEAEKLREKGINKIVESLQDDNPVLVSAVKKFKEVNKFHMMILIGFEGDPKNPEGFYYHDPDAESVEEGKNLLVPLEVFQKYWRKMTIFIHP